MAFGAVVFTIGYALFYWGIHHFPDQCRYSLWTLLGVSSIFKSIKINPQQPVQFKTS